MISTADISTVPSIADFTNIATNSNASTVSDDGSFRSFSNLRDTRTSLIVRDSLHNGGSTRDVSSLGGSATQGIRENALRALDERPSREQPLKDHCQSFPPQPRCR